MGSSDELVSAIDRKVVRINDDEEMKGMFITYEEELLIRESYGFEEGLEQGIEQGRAEGREEGVAKGLEQGIEQGESRFAALAKKLLSANKADDLERATEDVSYRDKLFAEYGL